MEPQLVLVYGNSLFIAGVAAQLSATPGLRVERVVTAATLGDRCPAVVIFDLAGASADLVLGWLIECAQLILVGLDLRRSRVIVFRAGAVQLGGIEDLIGLVRRLGPGGSTEAVVS